MDSTFAPEDLSRFVNEISRFAAKSVAPKFQRPEELVAPELLGSLMKEATENGFLNTEEETGISIWEQTDDPILLQFSCQALSELALKNPGLAYLCHHTSLSYYLVKQLGYKFKAGETPVISLQGHYGLARHSLARYFVDELDSEDTEVLKDYFNPTSEQFLVLHSLKNWTHLLSPVLDKNKVIQFEIISNNTLSLKSLEGGHGLNEASSFLWQKKQGSRSGKTTRLTLAQSQNLFSRALQMQWLGLISIARGATEKGYQQAKAYAAMRVQGGKAIAHHPAVQQMLSQTKSAIRCCDGLLTNICAQPLSKETLVQVAEVRSQLHPLLCKGANNAMQVFGGMGYMRDTGLEKIVRDVAQLKLMNGTPTELMLFTAELERNE